MDSDPLSRCGVPKGAPSRMNDTAPEKRGSDVG